MRVVEQVDFREGANADRYSEDLGHLALADMVVDTHEEAMPTQSLHERHPDWPKLSFNMYYHRHGTAKDFEEFDVNLDSADIFIPESANWTEQGQSNLDRISHTPKDEDSVRRLNSFLGQAKLEGRPEGYIMRHLLGSDVEPFYIDLPAGHPLLARLVASSKERIAARKNVLNFEDFETAVDAICKTSEKYTQLQAERERVMMDSLEPQLSRLFERKPELKDKSSLSIFMPLGANHTSLSHALSRQGEDVSRSFKGGEEGNNYIYDFESELGRCYLFGIEPSRELKAKVVLQTITQDRLNMDATIDEKREWRARLDNYTYDEVKALFEESKAELINGTH